MELVEKRYSLNDEDFEFSELEDLMARLSDEGELNVGSVYYEADITPMSGKDLVRAESLIEDMEYRLYEEVGESADGGLDISKEARAELAEFLASWLDKHADIDRYFKFVGKTRVMRITDADMADNE